MKYAQLFVRLAVGTAFLSAVADRMGLWGSFGQPGVAWGNWDRFVAYTHQLTVFAGGTISHVLAIIATLLETVLGILLIIGYRIKMTAFFSGGLLLLFAIAMTVSLPLGIKSTFDYSVWTGASACLLLSSIPRSHYAFSLDRFLQKSR